MSVSRRQFMKMGTALGSYAAIQSIGCSQKPTTKQPNILLIYADDLGYGDLGCYGGTIPTPNIDSIAQKGIRFTQFYVSSPACTPSRYSLLTGCYPHRSKHGLNKVYMPGDDIHFDNCENTLPEMLKNQGYNTAIFGKWHLGKSKPEYLPMHHGFDQFCGMPGGCVDYFRHTYGPLGKDWYVDNAPRDEKGYSTELITDHALDYLEKASLKDNPFFVYLAYNAPHYGKSDVNDVPENTLNLKTADYQGQTVMNTLQAPAEYLEKFSHIEDPYRRYYTAMVACMDDQIGRVLEYLDKNGLRENTMIWFISDNGGYSESYYQHADNGVLRGEKATVYEGGIRIPAMVSWGKKLESGRVEDQMICNMDIVPTLAKILNFDKKLVNQTIDGMDVSETLLNKAKVPERSVMWTWADKYAVRRGPWKLVHETELYNIENDKSEKHDLAGEYPDKVQALKKELERIKALPPYSCP